MLRHMVPAAEVTQEPTSARTPAALLRALFAALLAFGQLRCSNVRPSPAFLLAYPPADHRADVDSVLLIGQAPLQCPLMVDGQAARRDDEYFAIQHRLNPGENSITITCGVDTVVRRIFRVPPRTVAWGKIFLPESLYPAVDIVRTVGDHVCFRAALRAGASVQLVVSNGTLPMAMDSTRHVLPDNHAALAFANAPASEANIVLASRCVPLEQVGRFTIRYDATYGDIQDRAQAIGTISVVKADDLAPVEVSAGQLEARTGPGSEFARLTPLPRGTRARVIAEEGEWLQLSYGAWVPVQGTRRLPVGLSVDSMVKSVSVRDERDWTTLLVPLESPAVATLSFETTDTCIASMNLTLHDTKSQTDLMFVEPNEMIRSVGLTGHSGADTEMKVRFARCVQWGYKTEYRDTTLAISFRHPPSLKAGRCPDDSNPPLILIDPGHGGAANAGAVAPNGALEKDMTLAFSRTLQGKFVALGFKATLSRTVDVDLPGTERQRLAESLAPTLVLSIHFNALPDNGDPAIAHGASTYWFHEQARPVAEFLNGYLAAELKRTPYGTAWDNLAITRIAAAPAVAVELGFLMNPREFRWLQKVENESKLADVLATGVRQWVCMAAKQ